MNIEALLSKEEKSSDIKKKEFCFAKNVGSSYWDSLTSQETELESSKVLDLVLDFIKDDY